MPVIRICLADDHPVLLSGVQSLLADSGSFEVVGIASNAAEALRVVRDNEPDLIIMDLNMPGDVIGVISAISAAKDSKTRVLAFTAVTGVDYAIAALEAGASGYVLKGCSIEELKAAICAVKAGETYISSSFASKVVSGVRTASLRRKAREACRFSVREEQVLRLLLTGQTNGEIADALTLSDKTIKHYMTVIMQKLNVRNRIEVVLAAQKMGLDGSSADIPAKHVN